MATLVPEESDIEAINAVFKRLDREGNGFVSKNDLIDLFMALESFAGWTRPRLKRLFDSCDKGEKDKLRYTDFVDWLMRDHGTEPRQATEPSKVKGVVAAVRSSPPPVEASVHAEDKAASKEEQTAIGPSATEQTSDTGIVVATATNPTLVELSATGGLTIIESTVRPSADEATLRGVTIASVSEETISAEKASPAAASVADVAAGEESFVDAADQTAVEKQVAVGDLSMADAANHKGSRADAGVAEATSADKALAVGVLGVEATSAEVVGIEATSAQDDCMHKTASAPSVDKDSVLGPSQSGAVVDKGSPVAESANAAPADDTSGDVKLAAKDSAEKELVGDIAAAPAPGDRDALVAIAADVSTATGPAVLSAVTGASASASSAAGAYTGEASSEIETTTKAPVADGSNDSTVQAEHNAADVRQKPPHEELVAKTPSDPPEMSKDPVVATVTAEAHVAAVASAPKDVADESVSVGKPLGGALETDTPTAASATQAPPRSSAEAAGAPQTEGGAPEASDVNHG